MQQNGCQPAYSTYPVKEPYMAADWLYKIIQSARKKRMLDFFSEQLNVYGNTFTVTTLRSHAVHTNEPENLKTIAATKFDDWSVRPGRLALEPLMLRSVFMVDGPEWSHARALIRPIFVKDQVSDLDSIEEHVQALLALIPKDGSTVELQDLFHRFTLDTSSEFLFGQSAYSLRPNQSDALARFDRNVNICMADAIDRSRYGPFYALLCDKNAAEALKELHAMIDGYVQDTLARVNNDKDARDSKTHNGRYSFLDELARGTRDTDTLRGNAITMLTAGRDTTASLLSNLWFVLAREPTVWKRLLAEVDELEGKVPTYEWIRNARYMRYTEHEGLQCSTFEKGVADLSSDATLPSNTSTTTSCCKQTHRPPSRRRPRREIADVCTKGNQVALSSPLNKPPKGLVWRGCRRLQSRSVGNHSTWLGM